jgi:hypothetical protein
VTENGLTFRDVGFNSPYSMKDNYLMSPLGKQEKAGICLLVMSEFMRQWSYSYKTQPRKNKIHRSGHPVVFLGLSLYLPYRYRPQINTALFSLTGSSNIYLNMLVRAPSYLVIYGSSILAGQLLARWYWVYKRSYNATKDATLNSYIFYKKTQREPFMEYEAYEEVRPKLSA